MGYIFFDIFPAGGEGVTAGTEDPIINTVSLGDAEIPPLLRDDVIDKAGAADLVKCLEMWAHDIPGIDLPPGLDFMSVDEIRQVVREVSVSPAVREYKRIEAEKKAQADERAAYDELVVWNEKGGGIRLDHQLIADRLIGRYSPITFQKEVWICVDGLYRLEAGEILSFVAEVARRTGYSGSLTRSVREVQAYVAANEIAPGYPFDCFPNALPLANGVLVIDWITESATLCPYSPDYRFTHKWPVSYDPAASPEPIYEVLSQYVSDEEVPALYQCPAQAILHFCGYGPFKRSYIFEGPTNGGKSTYVVDFLNRIFGAENISGVSLQAIGKDRFVTATIGSAVINRCDDLSDVPVDNVGPFKALTGSFSHDIEKKFQTPYRGRVTAVHGFSTNAPPTVPDNVAYDPAFWSRWIYLRFNNVFEIDPGFVSRTFTPEAMSGAFNQILNAAFKIHQTGKLLFEQDPGEVKEVWQSAANPFQKFVNGEMQGTRDPVTFDKSQLFRAFLAWSKEHEINPRKLPSTLPGFTQMIYGSGFTTVRRGSKKAREWQYEGRYSWKSTSKYREMI